MKLALVSAFGVGGATIVGVIIGFFFRKVPHKFNDAILDLRQELCSQLQF